MATVNFYIDKPDSKGEAHIFLVFQMKGERFKTSTREKVSPKYWNVKKQRAKSIAAAFDINEVLDKMEAKIKQVVRDLKRSEEEYDTNDVKRLFQGE